MPHSNKWSHSVTYSLTFVIGLMIGATAMTGCGGGDDEKTASNGKKTSKKKNSGKKKSNSSSSKTQASAGRKEIDGIPYDVFYDDPLEVVSTAGSVAKKDEAPATSGTGEQPKQNDAKPTATVAGTDWKKIIPKEILESEVKKIRNHLTQYTQSVGNFNQNIFQIPSDAATLAMLAQIAIEHPEAVSWKDNAKYVRDLAFKMVEEKLMPGRKSFSEVEKHFQNIVDCMNGTVPPGLENVDEKRPFCDVADFGYLMKRLERAEKWAKSNVGNEAAFKEEIETALQEAHIFAAIAHVITTEGYGYADDDEFKGHAKPMLEASLKMALGAKSDAFASFDEGMNTVSQKCTQCHSSYRE